MSFFTTSLEACGHIGSQELELRVVRTRERASHETMRWSMLFGLLMALAVIAVLRDRVPHHLLAIWLGARVLASTTRLLYTLRYTKGHHDAAHPFRTYRMLCALDGLAWGAMGWGLTPVNELQVAIVTLCVVIGVAALGSSMLHVDLPSAALFVAPMLLPNALHGLQRRDDLGTFCAVAMTGLAVLLILEARRSNKRIVELLRLRFQSEEVTQTQAQALEQARILSETKSRFVATMSHEMRTPLHGILGLVRLLRQREKDTLAARQLDLVRSSGDHLVNVINDVLDFARLEAKGLPMQVQPFNLQALLNDVAEMANVTACEKGLALDMRMDLARETEACGDPVRIRQVLHNLLGNAIKFTPHGCVRLHVALDAKSGWLNFQVQDTGIGIPAHEQAEIFHAFHQAEGTYQRRFGGTGLGLTISRELARAMGGELTCRSEVGEGSVFTLSLPLPGVTAADSGRQDLAEAVNAAAPAAPLAWSFLDREQAPRVLVVEDNPVNALVAEAELLRLGVSVTIMSNGQEALDWLASQPVDLVLMDCQMPVMDGLEATRRIRARERVTGHAPVPIVALTANGPEAYAGGCTAAGMNDHLPKPFGSDDLARMLARHLGRSLVTG